MQQVLDAAYARHGAGIPDQSFDLSRVRDLTAQRHDAIDYAHVDASLRRVRAAEDLGTDAIGQHLIVGRARRGAGFAHRALRLARGVAGALAAAAREPATRSHGLIAQV